MPLYRLTKNGNVVKCKWNGSYKESYYGSYENALKYFGVQTNDIKSWGELINILIYHQTSDFTIKKLSNELYDILIYAQSDHKYWANPDKRHENAINTLTEAKKLNIIFDDELEKILESSKKINDNKRLYMYKFWIKDNEF